MGLKFCKKHFMHKAFFFYKNKANKANKANQ